MNTRTSSTINPKAMENETISRLIAARVLHGQPSPVEGQEIDWEARLGNEGPGGWTRGRSAITQAHLSRAQVIVSTKPHLAFKTGRYANQS